MTAKEIQAAKDLLYMRYYGDGCRVPQNLRRPWSKEDEAFEEELSCREMIDSILIYGGSCEKDSYQYDKYLKPYTEKGTWHDGLITLARLDELIKEQKADIEKAEIGFAGYDSEGVSYNYCRFADER